MTFLRCQPWSSPPSFRPKQTPRRTQHTDTHTPWKRSLQPTESLGQSSPVPKAPMPVASSWQRTCWAEVKPVPGHPKGRSEGHLPSPDLWPGQEDAAGGSGKKALEPRGSQERPTSRSLPRCGVPCPSTASPSASAKGGLRKAGAGSAATAASAKIARARRSPAAAASARLAAPCLDGLIGPARPLWPLRQWALPGPALRGRSPRC